MACQNAQCQGNEFQGEGYFPRCPECGGFHRDVTPAFRGLVLEACAALVPTSDRLHRQFGADNPASAWSYDRDTGLATLSAPGAGRAHANFHLVGAWYEETGAFDWAWADKESDHPDLAKKAEYARQVGAHYWLRTLTAPKVFVGETEAWHLAMITAYLSDLPMVGAVETETATIFVAMDTPIREN